MDHFPVVIKIKERRFGKENRKEGGKKGKDGYDQNKEKKNVDIEKVL